MEKIIRRENFNIIIIRIFYFNIIKVEYFTKDYFEKELINGNSGTILTAGLENYLKDVSEVVNVTNTELYEATLKSIREFLEKLYNNILTLETKYLIYNNELSRFTLDEKQAAINALIDENMAKTTKYQIKALSFHHKLKDVSLTSSKIL